MGLRHLCCVVLVLAVFAEVTLGQGYIGRTRGGARRCPPLCRRHCPTGFQRDSRGCEVCRCNPGLGGIGTFPSTGLDEDFGVFPQRPVHSYCPQGSVQDVSYPTCQASHLGGQLGGQCRRGYFCTQGQCCGYVSAFGDVQRSSRGHDGHRVW